MATYTFVCLECNNRYEVIRAMKDCDRPQLCICGKDMNRDYQADLVNGGGKDYRKAIHSDAMAISPDQRAEHERLFPDVKLDDQCRPIFDNFTKHEKYLKQTGFIKEPQKIKRSGAKRIA